MRPSTPTALTPNCSSSPWRPPAAPARCCATAARPTSAVAATKSSPIDVVTEMDIAAEKLITALLAERRPDDGFLGEEGAASRGHAAASAGSIDPLDGTVNYLYGLPTWAVSIAAEQDGETVVGVVAAPMRGETYHAVLRRRGAWPGTGEPACAAARRRRWTRRWSSHRLQLRHRASGPTRPTWPSG